MAFESKETSMKVVMITNQMYRLWKQSITKSEKAMVKFIYKNTILGLISSKGATSAELAELEAYFEELTGEKLAEGGDPLTNGAEN